MSDKAKKAGDTRLPPPVDGVVEVFAEEENEFGSVRVSERVIASVVRKFTLDVPGVLAFAGENFVHGLADILRRQPHVEAIGVNDMQGECVSIAVALVLEFGVVIPEVAMQVQETVRTQVEELTGKRVGKVDVIVQELREVNPDGEAPAAAAPAAAPAETAV